MSNKEIFVQEIEKAGIHFTEPAQKYFESLKIVKPFKMTVNGRMILDWFKENQPSDFMTSKQIGEKLGLPSRSVSGSMRKLCEEEYMIKKGENPVTYNINTNKEI